MTPDPVIGDPDPLTIAVASALAEIRRDFADARAAVAGWDLPRWEG